MKKIKGLALALLMMVALFVGCGTEKIVNEKGEEFAVDVSVKGDVKKGAPSIDSNEIELAGTTYTFPIKMSELFNNGWELNPLFEYDDTEIEAMSKTRLWGWSLVHESGMEIKLSVVINDSSENKDIKECTLTTFSIYTEAQSDYVLPGGIVPTSTAANVIKVFGNPNTTTAFSSIGCSTENELTYGFHESSGIAYSFGFNEDGTIHSVDIEYDISIMTNK